MKLRPFTTVLRKAGFIEVADDRDLMVFEKTEGRRVIEVQLWRDGYPRACHRIDGCSDTKPTDFQTVEEMVKAIHYESTRSDNGWLATGTKERPNGDIMVLTSDGKLGIFIEGDE